MDRFQGSADVGGLPPRRSLGFPFQNEASFCSACPHQKKSSTPSFFPSVLLEWNDPMTIVCRLNHGINAVNHNEKMFDVHVRGVPAWAGTERHPDPIPGGTYGP
eukprot:EG_transcript_25784